VKNAACESEARTKVMKSVLMLNLMLVLFIIDALL
jgi:hypothetical protein